MDTLETYRQVIEKIFNEYAQIPYAYGDVQTQVCIDRQGDHYLLMAMGWDSARRIHGCIVHIDIIDGKLWVQEDGTEQGIVDELVDAGIPRNRIVLGFHPADLRQYTGYAAA